MGGEDYEVSYQDDEGEIQTEIRTRWYPTSGHVHNFFDDVLINASNKLKSNLIKFTMYIILKIFLHILQIICQGIVQKYIL